MHNFSIPITTLSEVFCFQNFFLFGFFNLGSRFTFLLIFYCFFVIYSFFIVFLAQQGIEVATY